MPVEFETETTAPVQRRQRPPRRRVLIAAAALVLVAAGAALVTSLLDSGSSVPRSGQQPGPAVLPLPRGSVVFGGGGTREVHGIPVGYPHLPIGGVSAAYNLFAGLGSKAIVLPASREQVQQAIFAPSYTGPLRVTAGEAERARARHRVDTMGVVLNPDGTVATDATFVRQTLGRYGAYRVRQVSRSRVVVDVWVPHMMAVVTRTDRGRGAVRVQGAVNPLSARVTTRWVEGDWQITAIEPLPLNVEIDFTGRPVVTFAQRAAALGAGWVMPKNATERPGAWQR